MICDHPDCSTRTTDACGACGIPFCARHLYPDGHGRYCGPCRHARWRKEIGRDVLIVLALLVMGPLLPVFDVYSPGPVTMRDVAAGAAIGVAAAAVYGALLARKLWNGPPVNTADRRPRR